MKRGTGLLSRGFVFCVFFSCFSVIAFTQGYLVHRYSESDGLASAYVHDIAQDLQGKMWFATRSGIAVYDGVTWGKFTVSDGLPVLSFIKINIDGNGRVWVLGDPIQGGVHVAFYDGSRWNSIPEPEGFGVNLSEITSLALLDQAVQTELPTLALGTTAQGIIIRDREKWHYFNRENGLPGNKVNGVTTLDGKFYAATDNGLTVITANLQVDNRLNHKLGLTAEEIKGIAVQYKDKFADSQLQDSRVWLYGKNWLGYFEAKGTKLVRYPLGLMLSGKKHGINLLPDYRCGVYAGDRFILNYFNYKSGTWDFLDAPNGLSGGGTNSLYIDFEKNIWIACDRGVSKISSRRFTNFQRVHGLFEDEVSAVLEYEPGKFILGHNFGLTYYDGKDFLRVPFTWKNTTQPVVVRVLEMQADAENNIWLAGSWAGLGKITPNNPQQITWYGTEQGLPDKISCLWIDKPGNRLWVGTVQGIFLLTCRPSSNQKEEIVVTKAKGHPTCDSRRIVGAAGKLRYIASNSAGLFVYNEHRNRWLNYMIPGNTNANAVYAIKKDHKGRLLIGTLDGLLILEKEMLHKFESNGFHLDRPVYFILEDHRQRLWFGTDNGLVRWDGNTAKSYSTGEGLVGQETNRAAAITDARGRIWIGTNLGLSIYDEDFDNETYNPPPKVRLSSLEVSEKQVALTENRPIRLGFRDNTIAFHFRGISFLDETAIRFKNKLEGYEKKWSEESYPYQQVIRYSNLPPGTYRFHLKAANALGVWSDAVVSPEIIILKPFYRTWWFFLFLMFLFGGGLYAGFRYFSQKRYAATLENQVEERTRQLRAAEQQYRSLFEESKDMVFMSTITGKLLDLNPAGVELFGCSTKEEALNISSIQEIYYNPVDRDLFKAEISKNGFVKDYETVLKRNDGEPIIVWITATVVRDARGEIFGFRGIVRDITRQKKLEQQLVQAQKMEAIGTLAGGIAHDFNNILGAIIGYSELVLEDVPPNTLMQQNVQNIFNAAQRAAELVKQILAFSRQSQQKRKPIIMGVIVKEALKLLRSSLPATIEIREFIQPDTGAILGDATQIHQVMMNLAANAAHAMKETGGILEVRLQEIHLQAQDLSTQSNLNPGSYLRLTVSDTGYGIPRVVMKRIFEPYFTTKKTGEGTGMGLAVIHGIMKSHGGDISVYSEPGKGSTFHVFFPKIEEQEETGSPPQEQIPGGSEHILLVDDEKALAETGSRMLERLGYKVVGVSNPIEALEFFKKAPGQFHLVISDLTMPHMTGIQLAEHIKKISPGIPIIICSGFSATLDTEQVKALGISDFVMKPIVRSELARVVRRVLDSVGIMPGASMPVPLK